jgi:hypothetical protein
MEMGRAIPRTNGGSEDRRVRNLQHSLVSEDGDVGQSHGCDRAVELSSDGTGVNVDRVGFSMPYVVGQDTLGELVGEMAVIS